MRENSISAGDKKEDTRIVRLMAVINVKRQANASETGMPVTHQESASLRLIERLAHRETHQAVRLVC